MESARSSRNDVAKIQIQNKIIEECKKRKLLGITFDNNITMSKHIKKTYANRRAINFMH